ncbi:hypothetical protein XELAEV_18033756mg [Xenopus laevis]|uniref:Uncharacterized protein n=1 Tax=Xenopus laevis TaxID=8355 RepID=A0A974CK28_XENLA|nr:hypothetical protein XELAEV_18033756mg [Xenopus laevis]
MESMGEGLPVIFWITSFRIIDPISVHVGSDWGAHQSFCLRVPPPYPGGCCLMASCPATPRLRTCVCASVRTQACTSACVSMS